MRNDRKPTRTNPGEVVISTFAGGGKSRPWVVIWVDDEADEACLVAITSTKTYPGVIATGHKVHPHVGAWVQMQPRSLVDKVKRGNHTFTATQRQHIWAQLRINLGFDE